MTPKLAQALLLIGTLPEDQQDAFAEWLLGAALPTIHWDPEPDRRTACYTNPIGL